MGWYRSQSEDVQAAFRDALINLGRRADWKGNRLFKECRRTHKGLAEIRFSVGAKGRPNFRRFRLIGISNISNREFILLVGCEKPERANTIPKDAFDLALDLKTLLEREKGRVSDFNYD